MNIVVLLKQTFDTEEKIEIENGKVMDDDVKLIINPYDEYAVEEAVLLKEEYGGEITVITIGPEEAKEAIQTALAMGGDRGIHVVTEDFKGDEHTIAKILSEIIKKIDYHIILAGYMAVDNGSAQVGPRVAQELNIPHVTTIVKLEIEDDKVYLERDVEGGIEYIESTLPILVTTQQGLNEPRYPSLPSIMKAKRKPIESLSLEELDLQEDIVREKTKLVEQFLPPKKEAGLLLEGELNEQTNELVRLLVEDRKIVKGGQGDE